MPGYRDVDASGADLDAWFADRDVQGYVDRLDRKASRRPGADEMTLAWATAGAASLDASFELDPAESDQAALTPRTRMPTPLWQQRWVRPAAAALALVGITVAGVVLVRRNWNPAPLMAETARTVRCGSLRG